MRRKRANGRATDDVGHPAAKTPAPAKALPEAFATVPRGTLKESRDGCPDRSDYRPNTVSTPRSYRDDRREPVA